ncbi:sulfur reduction protein DsrE [Methanothermobacter sp. THM-1]|uniref:DsrE/DsrF/TusD sulfur relay family protein n=1 Tax=Methanothermobacter sp. THM-1 TaxID=2606911 RepID=UPI0013674345|nr:DsrE/DsrF/TusD sulfur relay family protein [Methanothermobacter sp. THM-1]QHN07047.1 sulfur reduction protein DsrE [Methanothermobacter sp. THM-1]
MDKKILTLVITEGPYRHQYADIAYEMAESALRKGYGVKIFLYMDGTHIPKRNQAPQSFPNTAERFRTLLKDGAEIISCIRCSTARGHTCSEDPYIRGVQIKSVYELAEWIKKSHKVITLGC